jgi:hypothetical protein
MPNVKESMAAGYKMVSDANLQGFSERIGCVMAKSEKTMRKNLAMATVTHPRILIGRQQTMIYLRKQSQEFSKKWNERFERLAKIESEIAPFFEKDSKDKDSLEEDAIAQLSFQHNLLKPLNHIPYLLVLISIFKVWVVPTASLLMPLIVWILPYILLRFVYALPITQGQYIHIIQHIMNGNIEIPPIPDVGHVPEPMTMRSIFQYLMFAFTFVQSMIQPIQNAMHLYKTDDICTKIGRNILEVKKIISEFRSDIGQYNGIHVKLAHSLDGLNPTDSRMAFISIQDCPDNIHMIFRDIAQLECVWRIANTPLINPVTFSRGVIKLEDCYDISLSVGDPVKSTIHLQEKSHSILTGPNGGGKSSFLRSVLQSVLMGHAFGFAPAAVAHMPRFTWIASGLQLRDSPGKLSMFETEVKFAADCINRARKGNGPGLILYDELFHSTNPHDSARSASQFLRRLWKQQDVFTIISTHLFPIVSTAPENVQAICCSATKDENGEITYSYGVQPGICSVSSVHKVWEKFGLVPPRTPIADKTTPANSL